MSEEGKAGGFDAVKCVRQGCIGGEPPILNTTLTLLPPSTPSALPPRAAVFALDVPGPLYRCPLYRVWNPM